MHTDLEADGLFRVPGNHLRVKELVEMYNNGNEQSLLAYTCISKKRNIHCARVCVGVCIVLRTYLCWSVSYGY